MAYGVLYLACLTGDLGDWRRAGVLHGSVQGVQDRAGIPWDEFGARQYRDSFAQARARMGDERLERAYAQGLALSLKQALDLALSSEAGSSEAASRDPLSAREGQIMALLAGGASNARIAQTLFVTPNTVRTHLDRILPGLRQLGIPGQPDLICLRTVDRDVDLSGACVPAVSGHAGRAGLRGLVDRLVVVAQPGGWCAASPGCSAGPACAGHTLR
jgi:DNA-binding CsgD family transcriptional regulator